ncbi:MAG: glycosyltransferase [Pseudomonadota bacterium]|jgi:glycosyltransferase involved in cell wall biosynthesis
MTGHATLPIHFFTIVLDGEPYIRYHLQVLQSLDIPWHWHIVEGVAELAHDTSWSLAAGGRVPDERYRSALSSDGTSDYLDTIARENPNNITLYRKPTGQRWDGKIEMVRAPLNAINDECLLWQIDSDELWTSEQIQKMHEMFLSAPQRYAAFFWCHYFVGPDKVIATRNCYAQNPSYEWLRVWRFQPGMQWVTHEPPTLAVQALDGSAYNVASINPFTHVETEAAGLVFQHMSYTTEAQLRFKEQYYGYTGATERWRALQNTSSPYVLLRDFFPWVTDSTLVTSASRQGITILAEANNNNQTKPSLVSATSAQLCSARSARPIRLAIDGVFFQLNSTGIARMWHSILAHWSASGVLSEVLLLDRGGTMPSIPGASYLKIPLYSIGQSDTDRSMLQSILDQYEIPLFASTYYTSVHHTQSLQLVYDMIPEVLGFDIAREPAFIEKHAAFAKAKYFVCISENTQRDLHRFFPSIPKSASKVVYPGVDTTRFKAPTASDVVALHTKYGITKPYFLMVGSGGGYKNAVMLTEALSHLPSQHGFEILLVTRSGIPGELAEAVAQGMVRAVALSDDELRSAYGGAIALVYPSMYEGFGLPILEAMACNCPVIANDTASIPEVAGSAALYARNARELASALCEVQKPDVQQQLVLAGQQRTRLFSWDNTAQQLWAQICSLTEAAYSENDGEMPQQPAL